MFVIGLSGLNQLNDNFVLTLDDGVEQCKDSVKNLGTPLIRILHFFPTKERWKKWLSSQFMSERLLQNY